MAWDLVIIDEAHRMGGSTEQVARYKLGAAWLEASPHCCCFRPRPPGKTDQFMRLMQLLDGTPSRRRAVSAASVQAFVIRTEKRAAIKCRRRPLFRPRIQRLHPVAWQARHAAQQQLYEAVTGLMCATATARLWRLGSAMSVSDDPDATAKTSSTAAIRATLRNARPRWTPQTQPAGFDTLGAEDWADWMVKRR